MMAKHRFAAGILGSLVVGVSAQAVSIYIHESATPAPDPTKDVAQGEYWQPWSYTPQDPKQFQTGDTMYVGLGNYPLDRIKCVWLQITGTNLHRLAPLDQAGLGATQIGRPSRIDTSTPPKSLNDKWWKVNSTQTVLHVAFMIDPQPDGEWVKLSADGAGATITKIKGWSKCYDRKVNDRNWTEIQSRNNEPPGAGLYTELYAFPRDVAIDTSLAPTLNAPPGTGPWSYQFVSADPDGTPCPLGGVKWTTTGTGIPDDLDYTLRIPHTGEGNLFTDVVEYDGNNAKWARFVVACPEPGTFLAALCGLGFLRRPR